MRIKQHVRDAEADGAGRHRRALRQSGELATDQTGIESPRSGTADRVMSACRKCVLVFGPATSVASSARS